MKVLISRYPKGDKKRNVQVRIDNYDTFSADHTLALIIHPLLVRLKEIKHSSAMVADEDVPDNIKSTSAKPKENEWDTDEFVHVRWDYVLDEMIWAMKETANGDGDSKFFDHSAVDDSKDLMEQLAAIEVDHEGLDAYNKRIQNGCLLFGKYFKSLWT
jgi:hypothetical protein